MQMQIPLLEQWLHLARCSLTKVPPEGWPTCSKNYTATLHCGAEDKASAQRRLILRSYDNETLLIALHQPCSHPAGALDPPCMPSTQSLAMQMVCLATTVCLAPGEMSPAWLTSHRTSPWLSWDRQGCLKHTHEPRKLSTRVLQLS